MPLSIYLSLQVRISKAMIDNKPPENYMHLHLKRKKAQMEEERQQKVRRDNQILLDKMSHIMRTRGSVDNRNNYQQRRCVCVCVYEYVHACIYIFSSKLLWLPIVVCKLIDQS